jgi:HlyD family secretion protein
MLRKALVIVAIVVVAIVVIVLIMRGRVTKIEDVRTAEAEIGQVTKAVVATGEIRPLSVAEIKSKIGGVVRRFFVEEGDAVRKGQRLAEIIPTATPEQLVYARERVETARLSREQAERKLARAEELAAKNLVSTEAIEDAETELSLAAARYDAALAELQVLEQGATTRRSASGNYAGAQTAGALEDMIILSPVSGIVLSRDVDEGSSVIAMSSAYGGTGLMTLADVSKMHFEGYVDESDVAKIHVGMPTKIFVDALPETTFTGVLTKIAPQGEKQEGVVNFRVEAEIDEDTALLRTGMSADVQLVLDERIEVLTVPEGAMIYEGDSTFVEVVDETAEGGKRKIFIKVGLSDGIKTEVVEGLEEGDKVVLQ